jgi:hypothetical protein
MALLPQGEGEDEIYRSQGLKSLRIEVKLGRDSKKRSIPASKIRLYS